MRLFRNALTIIAFSTTFAVAVAPQIAKAQASVNWVARLAAANPAAMVTDSHGDTYVAGGSCTAQDVVNGCTASQTFIVKYDSNGNQLWQAVVGGGVHPSAKIDIALDAQENVYVLSDILNSATGLHEIGTAKYGPTGTRQWLSSYAGPDPNNATVSPVKLAVGSNVYVTGTAAGSTNNVDTRDSVTIKYDLTGKQLWSRVVNGSVQGGDSKSPLGLALDPADNSYVAVSSYFNSQSHSVSIYKYDGNGNVLLQFGANRLGSVAAMKADASGRLYLAGGGPPQAPNGTENAIVAVFASDGNLVWLHDFGPPSGGVENARFTGVADNATGDIFATESLVNAAAGSDIVAMKLSGSDGTLLWQKNYNGRPDGSGQDQAVAIAANSTGDLYVTGSSSDPTVPCCLSNIATIKYDGAGNQVWVQRFTGPAHAGDRAVAISLGPSGRALVTGNSASSTSSDMVTISYTDPPPGPGVNVAPTNLTFTSTVGNVTAAQRITVTNKAASALTITAAPAISGANATDFAVEGSTTCTNGAKVAAGSACSIDVTFKPTATGGRSASLAIKDSDSSSPQTVTLSGTGDAPPGPGVTVVPANLTFSGSVGSVTASQRITVQNIATSALTISAAPAITGANAGDFAIAGSTSCTNGAVVASGSTCSIDVTFKATATGNRTATLVIKDSDTSSPQSVSLAGTGVNPAGPVLTFAPGSLAFPAEPIGTTTPAQNVTLSNTGGTVLNISLITFGGSNPADFKGSMTCGQTLAPGDNCVATVTFTPTAKGDRTAVLAVSDDEPGSPQTVSLTGKGVGISLTSAQPSVSISAGQTATYHVNVVPTAFSGTVTFTCSGTPAGASCNVSPASAVVNGDTLTPVTVNVTTTARSQMYPWRWPSDFNRLIWILLLVTVLPGWLVFARNSAWRWKPSFAMLALLLIASAGCAGTTSGSAPPPTAKGTPAGTSTLNLTATSGSSQATLPLTLTVN